MEWLEICSFVDDVCQHVEYIFYQHLSLWSKSVCRDHESLSWNAKYYNFFNASFFIVEGKSKRKSKRTAVSIYSKSRSIAHGKVVAVALCLVARASISSCHLDSKWARKTLLFTSSPDSCSFFKFPICNKGSLLFIFFYFPFFLPDRVVVWSLNFYHQLLMSFYTGSLHRNCR